MEYFLPAFLCGERSAEASASVSTEPSLGESSAKKDQGGSSSEKVQALEAELQRERKEKDEAVKELKEIKQRPTIDTTLTRKSSKLEDILNEASDLKDAHNTILEHAVDGTADSDLYWNVTLSANSDSADEIFEKIDADHSGEIEEAEVHDWLRREELCGGSGGQDVPEILERFMKEMDNDNSGTINRLEFSLFLKVAHHVLFPLRAHELESIPSSVFLGGSCNPTTWRKDVSIPLLQRAGVTYYSPQVDDWHPGLLALEDKAKQEAVVHLFVIDHQTRALASMLEVAELVTKGENVVLVLQDVIEGQMIGADEIQAAECKDLNRCRSYLADLCLRNGMKSFIYKNVVQGTMAAISVVNQLQATPSCTPSALPTLKQLKESVTPTPTPE